MKNPTTLAATILISLLVLVGGIARFSAPPTHVTRVEHQRDMKALEIRRRFEQGVVMLHARQYDHAITALHRVLELAPRMPEAHANMGYAFLGLEQPATARTFFAAALELNPRQANAYYGMALVEEARGDFESALGNMRTYLHFTRAEDPHRNRARAALWEWEQKLGRHPPSPPAPEAAATPAGPATAPAPAGSAAEAVVPAPAGTGAR